MKTLVIAAHPDDEVISCGGLIRKRVLRGHHIGVLCVFGRSYDYGRSDGTGAEIEDMGKAREFLGYQHLQWLGVREGEPFAAGHYGLLGAIERSLASYQPDEVLIPSAQDLNQDHRHLHELCRIALRSYNLGTVRRVLQWLGMDGVQKRADFFVVLDKPTLEAKLAALACFGRESRVGNSPRAPDVLSAQARIWGSMCNRELAEGYETLLHVED